MARGGMGEGEIKVPPWKGTPYAHREYRNHIKDSLGRVDTKPRGKQKTEMRCAIEYIARVTRTV